MRILACCLTLAALAGVAGHRAAPASAGADDSLRAELVLSNGRIWTLNKSQPEAQALASWRGRIVYIGSTEGAKAFTGPQTRVIDLKGRRVLPGFFDSHVHMLNGGMQLGRVSLKDAKDEAEFGRRLREFDEKLPRDRWLLGGDWDHDRTFGGRLPTAELIDKYVKDRPVFLRRYDGHMAVVNSHVLKKANITAQRPDPVGGVIVRKPESNEPTGVLRDKAMELVTILIPRPAEGEVREAIAAALAEARQYGVTSVQDMDGSDALTRRLLLRHYQQLARQGALTCRIDLRWPLADWQELARLGVEAGFGDDWVRIGGLKGFLDGSLGSSTAKMFESYEHEKGNTGTYLTPLTVLRQQVEAADKAGLHVCVHAIGDRANAELLTLFDDVARTNGPRDRRFRIEHAQHLRPAEYARFASLQVIPSMQPYHIIDDGRWAEGRIGAQRCSSSYANRSLLDAKARLAFGSDWPVAPLNPLLGIDAAVHRRTLDGKHPGGWFPQQKITVAEAIEAYTLGSAYAAFQEKDRGTLEVGKLADLVVLTRDILDPAEVEEIARTRIAITVVGGKVVFERVE